MLASDTEVTAEGEGSEIKGDEEERLCECILVQLEKKMEPMA